MTLPFLKSSYHISKGYANQLVKYSCKEESDPPLNKLLSEDH